MSDRKTIKLSVNGKSYEKNIEPRLLLIDFIRGDLGLTGTHVGCEQGVCGACTVILNGDSIRSCLTFAVQCDGSIIETVEGIGSPEALSSLQKIFRKHHALQCGFCTAGILMTTIDILRKFPLPTENEIRSYISGNLCRCTGYTHIVAAIMEAVANRNMDDKNV